MTSNQLSYQANEEVARHNTAVEDLQDAMNKETRRHNLAIEALEQKKTDNQWKLEMNRQRLENQQVTADQWLRNDIAREDRQLKAKIAEYDKQIRKEQNANTKYQNETNRKLEEETVRHNLYMEDFQETMNNMKWAEITMAQAMNIAHLYDLQEQRRIDWANQQTNFFKSLTDSQRLQFDISQYLATGQLKDYMSAIKDGASSLSNVVSTAQSGKGVKTYVK